MVSYARIDFQERELVSLQNNPSFYQQRFNFVMQKHLIHSNAYIGLSAGPLAAVYHLMCLATVSSSHKLHQEATVLPMCNRSWSLK